MEDQRIQQLLHWCRLRTLPFWRRRVLTTLVDLFDWQWGQSIASV